MSQYGALGYANEGWTYDQILAHFYTGAELGPAPVARVRVLVAEAQAVADVALARRRSASATSSATIVPAAGGRGDARAEAARDRRTARRPSSPGPIVFLPGQRAARARPVAYRGQIEVAVDGAEAERDQRRRARAVPRRRRAAGDAERLARRGAEGAGGRGALVRARAPRSAARASTSTPTCAARSTAASPAETPAHDGGDRGDGRRGRCSTRAR